MPSRRSRRPDKEGVESGRARQKMMDRRRLNGAVERRGRKGGRKDGFPPLDLPHGNGCGLWSATRGTHAIVDVSVDFLKELATFRVLVPDGHREGAVQKLAVARARDLSRKFAAAG